MKIQHFVVRKLYVIAVWLLLFRSFAIKNNNRIDWNTKSLMEIGKVEKDALLKVCFGFPLILYIDDEESFAIEETRFHDNIGGAFFAGHQIGKELFIKKDQRIFIKIGAHLWKE